MKKKMREEIKRERTGPGRGLTLTVKSETGDGKKNSVYCHKKKKKIKKGKMCWGVSL